MAMIEMKQVSKWYGPVQVLNDCTTSIEKGQVVVVCGPSGSGKSTLIKTINALEPFSIGALKIPTNLRSKTFLTGVNPASCRGATAHHATLVFRSSAAQLPS